MVILLKLYPGKPEVYDKAPSGRLYVDGNISVVEDAQSIKDRKNLSANGYIEATILITPKGNIHKRPVLTFRGIPVDDTEEFVYGLEDAIEEITRTFKLGSKQQEHNLIDALKIACRKFSKEKTGKKPFTNINSSKNLMSITGLAIIYIIIWWIVFFVILPIDVNRTKTVKIDGEDPGSPENPKMLKKILILYRNYNCYFCNNLSINKI